MVFTAKKIYQLNNPVKSILTTALEKYCKSRERCCSGLKQQGECPIQKEIVSNPSYIDDIEEVTDATTNCDFESEYYEDTTLKKAYNLLPKEAREEADKELSEDKDAEEAAVQEEEDQDFLKSKKKELEVKVLGKIDLESMNQRTRPPRKTKEQKESKILRMSKNFSRSYNK